MITFHNLEENSIYEKDLKLKDFYGDTILHAAVLERKLNIVEKLLFMGADPNSVNNEGKTPLHHAAELNELFIAEILLSNKSNLNIEDNWGNQPLWVAVFNVKGEKMKLPIVELFLSYGADKSHKNKANRSPWDFANIVGYEDLIILLSNY